MASRKLPSVNEAKNTNGCINRFMGKSLPAKQDLLPSVNFNDLHERITARAYARYEERGYRQGYDLQDYLDAEREILSQ